MFSKADTKIRPKNTFSSVLIKTPKSPRHFLGCSELLRVLYYLENVLIKELSEVLSGNAYVNVIIYLNGNSDTVALSDAEATGKYDLVFEMMFFNSILHKFHDILRALQVTGGADTNLNEHHGDYTFAITVLAKNSPTVSGVTE